MEIESFGLSDTGLVREVNEDAYLADLEHRLFLVADGLGGLSKGDIASTKAVKIVRDFVASSRQGDAPWPFPPCEGLSDEENRLLVAIRIANREIYSFFQRDPQNFIGMGTTLTGLLLQERDAVIANVGDSRAYQIRGTSILQLTQDHSLVMEEVRRGRLSPEQARLHPQKHVLTQALGVGPDVSVDISSCPLSRGDLYLLCSDGLTDLLTDEEILQHLSSKEEAPLSLLAEELVAAAKAGGGIDNITVVLIRIHGDPPGSTRQSEEIP